MLQSPDLGALHHLQDPLTSYWGHDRRSVPGAREIMIDRLNESPQLRAEFVIDFSLTSVGFNHSYQRMKPKQD